MGVMSGGSYPMNNKAVKNGNQQLENLLWDKGEVKPPQTLEDPCVADQAISTRSPER
jgi:hypothetical protein